MTKKSLALLNYLDKILPNASCELNYSTDYELLIAVMLSAQTTDKAVNKVTEKLFKDFPTLEDLKNAPVEAIEEDIKTLGLSKVKSKNVKNIATDLIEKFNGVVPSGLKDLMSLSGVGRKTANVVRVEYFKIPELPVDTHIDRISKRLQYVDYEASVLEVEKELRKHFPKNRLILLHHQLIHFGRYYCKAQNPKCLACPLKEYCSFIRVR